MPARQVLFICALACACLAGAMATVAVPIARDSGQGWARLGGTLVAGTLLVLFMRHAGGSLDASPRGARR